MSFPRVPCCAGPLQRQPGPRPVGSDVTPHPSSTHELKRCLSGRYALVFYFVILNVTSVLLSNQFINTEGISPISGGEESNTFLPTEPQWKLDVGFSKVGSNPNTLTNPFLQTVGV